MSDQSIVSNENDGDPVNTLRSICNVSIVRAVELLEAASGSVERAVEIHFNHDQRQDETPKGKSTPPSKQATLDSFLQSPATTKESSTKKNPQSKLDLFFSKRAKTESKEPLVQELDSNSKIVAATKPCLKDPPPSLQAINHEAAIHSTALSTTKLLTYSMLTRALCEIIGTTKRTIKTSVLTNLFVEVIQSLGGIHTNHERGADAATLTSVMDLILGKLSTSSSSTNNGTVLQVSESAISTAVQTVTGVSRPALRNAYRKEGDLGDVAASFFVSNRQKQFFTSVKPQADLTIQYVHSQLQAIANVAPGKGSQQVRQNLLIKLLQRVKDKDELRFLVRTLIGNMRLGATVKTVIVALATAVEKVRLGTNMNAVAVQDAVRKLERVFNLCPSMDRINLALLCGGVPYAVEHCSIEIGAPVQPMLANPAHSFKEIQSFMTAEDGSPFQVVAEWKYDGVRCQAHWDGSTMKLFSRNMLDTTLQYPDATQSILEAKDNGVTSFIIDSEIVGVIPDEKCSDGLRLLPFQDLSTRRGTKNTDDADRVAVKVYAFDLLHINDRSLIDAPLWERQSLLRQYFATNTAGFGFGFAKSSTFDTYNQAELEQLLVQAVEGGAEGLMIKLTGKENVQNCGYESGARSQLWLKAKKDYLGGLADTIDVVPIGAWFGSGRKAQNGFLSPVLFAIYDDDEGAYRSISRCMSFSDDMYNAMREFYFRGTPYPPGVGLDPLSPIPEATKAIETVDSVNSGDEDGSEEAALDKLSDERVNCFANRPPSTYIITNESPPIFFKPSEVFEVLFADLTLSRAHTAAMGLVDDEEGRGVALRFPRFKRRRPDKGCEMATTSVEIARLYSQQSKLKS